MPRLRRASMALALAALTGLAVAAPGSAQTPDPAPGPDASAAVAADALGEPVVVADDLVAAVGRIEAVVQLRTPALAAAVPADARTAGPINGLGVAARTAAIVAEQDALAAALAGLGAVERARLQVALNAIVVDIDAAQLNAIAARPEVRSIRRLRDYRTTQTDAATTAGLAEAVELIGASGLHAAGIDGAGVRVAVLDTGIDYTHANLGGAGTAELYEACAAPEAAVAPATGACAAGFGPDAPKVKGGFDFVGERWPEASATLEPDPNPIDRQGHGTHVADILGGRSADGAHVGIAPGVDLYAVKVCSATSATCSGMALLQGVDHALDPDGDGDVSDAVDLINLSLGEGYGQGGDDLTEALGRAAELGVLVVTSAGNGNGRPYSVSSPSTSPFVLSVAETAAPGAVVVPVVADPAPPALGASVHGVPQPWAPLVTAVTGPAASPTTSTGCSPQDYQPAPPPGAVAVVRRGGCAASTKAEVARQVGAAAVVVVNDDDGAPPTYAPEGTSDAAPDVPPTLAVARTEGDVLMAAARSGTITLTLDPQAAVDVGGTVAPSSARGPSVDASGVKPDLAAPGGWRSAAAGTGSGEASFGGTSGAAPTVAGAAALLLQRFDRYPPSRLAAMLVGSAADARVLARDGTFGPAPATSVGGGEVRVDRAAALALTARGAADGVGISFGAVDVTSTTTLTRTVRVQNLTPDTATYAVAMTPSDPLDGASAAITASVAPEVTLAPFATVDLDVTLAVDAATLPPWSLAGRTGLSVDPEELAALEVDGTLTLTGPTGTVHVPWQVLPRRASAVQVGETAALGDDGRATIKVRNAGAADDARLEVFGLTGTSPALGPDAPVDLAAVGVRADATNVQFAIATFDRRAVPRYPGRFEIQVDATGDGVVDHYVFNAEQGGFAATGREVVLVQPATAADGTAPTATAWFATATDLNSATTVLTVPLAALGAGPGTTLRFDVFAYDGYASGITTDLVAGQVFTVDAPGYALVEGPTVVVPAGASTRATLAATGATAPTSETGVLVLTTADALGDFRTIVAS